MNINNGKTGNVNIPGALHSTGGDGDGQVGGVVAYAGDVYDETLDKNLAEVNSDFTEAINDINDNISSIQNDISPFTESINLQSLVEYDKIQVSEGINASQNNEVYINDKKLAMSFGYNNTISNDRKLAFGFGRLLNVPDNTFVIGQRNSYEPNAAFIVGNGTLNDSTNNAFVIGRDGNFWAYGINGYAGQLTGASQYNSVNHFITGLDTRLTALEGTTSSSSSAPTYSAGTGIIISNNTINVNASQLNYDDLNGKPDLDPLIATHDDRGVVLSNANQRVYALGNQSVAYGHSTNAYGNYSIAGGDGTRAWGDKSVAFGTDTIAFGDNTIASGNGSIAVGTESVAFGEKAYTRGKASGYFGKGKSVSASVIDSGVDVANNDSWYELVLESSANLGDNGHGYEEFRILPGMYITEYETNVNSEQPGWLIKNVEYIPLNLEWTCKVYIDDPNDDAPSDPQRLVVRGAVSEGYSYALGRYLFTTNQSEVAVGDYNVSHKSGGSAASGSGTIFSVGTGVLSDNSEYIPESMADPENYLVSNQTYRANALEVLTDGSVYVRGVGRYDGKSIANVDSLQTVITDVNTRLSDLEAASSSSSSAPTYSAGTGISISNNTISVNTGSLNYNDLSNIPLLKTAENGFRIVTHDSRKYNTASSENAFAEGTRTKASGKSSHAECYMAEALGDYSHAEGFHTTAYGDRSHAEGNVGVAQGYASHVEGEGGIAYGTESHVEGLYASLEPQITRAYTAGSDTIYIDTPIPIGYLMSGEDDLYIPAQSCQYQENEGDYKVVFAGLNENLEINDSIYAAPCAYGLASHTEGWRTHAYGKGSHAEGVFTVTTNEAEHASGKYNYSTSGKTQFSVGIGSQDSNRKNAFEITNDGKIFIFGMGDYDGTNVNSATALQDITFGGSGDSGYITYNEDEGYAVGSNTASGENSFAEGYNTKAQGTASHAEGSGSKAVGLESHAEGYDTYAGGNYSHAEGTGTQTSGTYSHAEGYYTTASGESSHAEGANTSALGTRSHAEGYKSKAMGNCTHAEGSNTLARNTGEHACGTYNKSTQDVTLFSIGNGYEGQQGAPDTRQNAFEVDLNSNVYIKGIGNYDGTNIGESGVKSVQQVIADLTLQIAALSNN